MRCCVTHQSINMLPTYFLWSLLREIQSEAHNAVIVVFISCRRKTLWQITGLVLSTRVGSVLNACTRHTGIIPTRTVWCIIATIASEPIMMQFIIDAHCIARKKHCIKSITLEMTIQIDIRIMYLRVNCVLQFALLLD